MSNAIFLDFEKTIAEYEGHIEELRRSSENVNVLEEITILEEKRKKELSLIYTDLTPWQKVQVARHPNRPHAQDYIKNLIEDFTPLAGDRNFAEDKAIIGGIGRFRGQSVVIMGTEKGHDTESRLKHNFGMAKPEGYRKAQRLMRLAEQFNLPIITLVDTSGAFPGKEAEERGQAEAIARSIDICLDIKVPLISIIIGEGGSGGAIALAAANSIFMLEHSIYSVISPEGCASILWRSSEMNKIAAKALKITAQDLKELKIIDDIIPEPIGGAHRFPTEAMTTVANRIEKELTDLQKIESGILKQMRADKFLEMTRL